MSIDVFWKRVPADALRDAGPKTLSDLVPYWFDAEFDAQLGQGLLVGTEDTGSLIAALLRCGAADDASTAAADLFARSPADWDDEWMVGTFTPGAVRTIAGFLDGAPLEAWARRWRDSLAAEAKRLGYRRPFNDDWSAQVLRDARDVAALFQAAAAEAQPIIVKVSA